LIATLRVVFKVLTSHSPAFSCIGPSPEDGHTAHPRRPQRQPGGQFAQLYHVSASLGEHVRLGGELTSKRAAAHCLGQAMGTRLPAALSTGRQPARVSVVVVVSHQAEL